MAGKTPLAGIVSGNRDYCRVALFDLDGTLVDSAPDICSSINQVMAHYCLPVVEEGYVRSWVGLGTQTLLKRALNRYVSFHHRIVSQDDFLNAYNLFLSFYRETNGKYASLYPDARTILATLTDQNFRVGVVTNRPVEFTGSIISRFRLDDLVQVVVCADQFGSYKPESGMLVYALSELGGEPKSSMMVGDSFSDIMAAKNAGVTSVYVRYGYRSNVAMCELYADRSIDSLLELV